MAKQQTEDELNLRRKARRRLIGAAALTLAVVVILPMVLDSEPKISGKDIDLHIPDPNAAGKFVPRVTVSDVALPAAASAVPATPAARPAQQPAEATKSAAEPAPVPIKAQPAAAPAKATESASKPAASEGFVAQVGAYSNQETAKQELRKLKHWGFKAYTEMAGDKMRVRVGPYADRDKAEKVARLLEKHGYHPVIVSAK